MKALVLLVPLMLGIAAGQASAADSGGLGTVLKDAATDAAGQAARDTIDKTAPRRDDRDRDVRDRDRDRRDGRDRDVRDRDRRDDRDRDRDRRDRDRRDRDYRDRDDAPGKSYEHRRDGRGAQDNPGRGKKKNGD